MLSLILEYPLVALSFSVSPLLSQFSDSPFYFKRAGEVLKQTKTKYKGYFLSLSDMKAGISFFAMCVNINLVESCQDLAIR